MTNQTQLLEELFKAYYDARRHKRNAINALVFEHNFEEHIFALHDQITALNYRPLPGMCFVVDRPVKREVFAADFRDRIVHHFIHNHLAPYFERSFIQDCYSCRKEKGTQYGIQRADGFIRHCSENYTMDCYVMKLDIKGYFMSMNRLVLYAKIIRELDKYREEFAFDYTMMMHLIERTLFTEPTARFHRKGSLSDWEGVPQSKSLFGGKRGCGLPIGNLTSQLFGNVYMNEFDHFVKEELGIVCYGRYVDDMIFVHKEKERLLSILPQIRRRLEEHEQLEVHPNKIYLQHYTKGVAFLGAYIKPGRQYILNRTKGHLYETIRRYNLYVRNREPHREEIREFAVCLNSYLGLFAHYATYRIRHKMLRELLAPEWWKYLSTDSDMRKVTIKKPYRNTKHWETRNDFFRLYDFKSKIN